VAMSLYGLVAMPLYRVGKFFYVPGRIDKVEKPRMYASLGVLVAALLAFVFVPLPHSVICTLEIQPRDAVPVYVDVAEGGRLGRINVEPGQRVGERQHLATLENIDLDLEIARLTGAQKQYETQLESLRRQRFEDPRAGQEIPQIIEAKETVEQQLSQKLVDYARLTLVAPMAGTVLPPPETPRRDSPDGQLPGWSGTPLEPKNIGAYLQEGVLFCQLGDPRKMEAILVIDQADRNFVEVGQKVEIKLDQLPHDTFASRIDEIAEIDLEFAPQLLSTKAGGDLPTVTDPETGVERLQSTAYQARAPVDDPDKLLRIALRGRGKIHAKWMPLGKRLWRFVAHTFNFKL